jgi:perosamine synthetase
MGWNYRMTNLQAALGVAQLEQIDGFLQKKSAVGLYYQENLSFLLDKGYTLPLSATDYAGNIYWVFGLVAPSEKEAQQMIQFLSGKHIGTRPFFWCMHEQPVFKKMGLFTDESYPAAERLARNGFYIPSGLGLHADETKYVTDAIFNFVNSYGK